MVIIIVRNATKLIWNVVQEKELATKQEVQGLKSLLSDYELYFDKCLKIVEFGTKKLIPFRMNQIQLILHEMAEEQLRVDGHVRIIVLKARRFGISTYIQGRFFKKCATEFNKVVHICTHDRATSDTMFQMAKTMETYYPQGLKPDVVYSGKRELKWGNQDGGGLNSRYSLSSVGGAEVRGDAVDYLHCSEVSSWGNTSREHALGLQNCVVTGHGTEIWMESTAKGVGGYFYDEFWRAYKNESGFICAFFPWFIFDEYRIDLTDEEKEELEKDLGKHPRYGGEEEEKILGHKRSYRIGGDVISYEIELENLAWRRKAIETQCQGDIDLFNQEYPTTEQNAFIASGRNVFDTSVLTRLKMESDERYTNSPPLKYTVPVNEYKFVDVGNVYRDKKPKYYLEPSDRGELTVWEMPTDGREYRVGVDVSEGLEVSRDTDYSVITVLDAVDFSECAVWRGKQDPDLLAWVVVAIAKWDNEAFVGVERNNHGLTTLSFLSKTHNYRQLYSEKLLDEKTTKTSRKLGWLTTSKTKPLMLDYLRELIREEQIEVKTRETLDELLTFVHFPNGKMGGQEGSHDDCVVSLAIAAQMCKLHPKVHIAPQRYSFDNPSVNYFHNLSA